jgi:hypothetical protein
MFPEDFVEFPMRDFPAEIKGLDFFRRPEVVAYAKDRANRDTESRGQGACLTPQQLLTQDVTKICKAFTCEESLIASRIRFSDLIQLDRPTPIITDYLLWIDRTIDYIRSTVNLNKRETAVHNFRIWMRVLLECSKYNNFQLEFEILTAVAHKWHGAEWRAFVEQTEKTSQEDLWKLNRIIERYNSSDSFAGLVLEMVNSRPTEGERLGFFLPILQRMKDLMPAFDSFSKDSYEKLRAIYGFAVVLLHIWRVTPIQDTTHGECDLIYKAIRETVRVRPKVQDDHVISSGNQGPTVISDPPVRPKRT